MKFDTERRYYVYVWYIKQTNEVFYVGKGTGNRYKTKKRENSYFTKMLQSHECDSKIVKENLTEKEAFDLEKETIAYYRTQNCRLTNILDGGENPPKLTGIPKSDEWKRKVRESNKKFYEKHPEARKKNSDNLKNYLRTEAGKEFQRKSIEARQKDSFKKEQAIRCRRANNTLEYKKRQSDIIKRMWKSEEYIKKHSGANNHASQSVKQYDLEGNFIKEYSTITQASFETGTNISKISAAAKGKRKTTGGYIWKFSNDKHIHLRRNNNYNVENDKCAVAIIQYDMKMNFVNEYKSIAEATRLNNFNNRTNIISNLKGRTKSAYGYIWKYKQDNTVPSL